jgi:hypothetical protein
MSDGRAVVKDEEPVSKPQGQVSEEGGEREDELAVSRWLDEGGAVGPQDDSR